MNPNEPRFAIGTKFHSSGKHPRVCTVTDIYRTYNSAGKLVKVRYAAVHELCGQMIGEDDICETSIAMRLITD